MTGNTTVRLHIGRLVVDAGTPLPPGGVAGLQAALEAALTARWSQRPSDDGTRPAEPAPAADTRTTAWVRQLADAIGAAVPAPAGLVAAPGQSPSEAPAPAPTDTPR